jgi:hypothetical protein
MRIIPVLAALTVLLVSGPAAHGAVRQPGDIEVMLKVADRARLGIEVSLLEAAESADTLDAIARVLDIGALAQLNADIAAAAAAAAASASEAERLVLLAAEDQSASRRELEAARAQADADMARLRLARQRVSLEWGPGLAALDLEQRQHLLEEIAAGRAALLRVDPLRTDGAGDATEASTIRLRPDPAKLPLATEGFGPAASTDPRLQTVAVLVVVRGEPAAALRAGRVLAAEIDSGRRLAGVVIPRDALVRVDGATWVYLDNGGDEFLRREVVAPVIRDDGWFVGAGFAPGDVVVSAGAGSLLAVERGSEALDED